MRVLLFLLAPFLLALPLQAQGDDEFTQAYFGIYQRFLDAQDLETSGQFRNSLDGYEECLDRLEQLMRENPGRQSDVLNRRRESVREAINRVRPDAANQAPSAAQDPRQNLPDPIRESAGERDQQIEQLVRQRDEMRRRLEQNQTDFSEAIRKARQDAAEARAELARVRDAAMDARQNSSQQVESLQAQVAQLRTELDSANERVAQAEARNVELLANLEQSRARIERMEEREAELIQERDKMIERAQLAASEAGIAQLAEDNERLTTQYGELQERFETLQGQSETSNAEAASLKLQVAQLQQEVESLQVENDSYRRQLADMKGQLDSTAEQLAAASADTDVETAVRENRLLRQELVRQQHLQEHRERMRDILLAQLDDIGIESKEFRRVLDSMATDSQLGGADRSGEIQRLIDEASGGTIVADSKGIDGPEVDLGAAGEQIRDIRELTITASEDFAAGRYERALHSLDIILGIVPNDVPTLVNRGVVLLRLGRSAESEDDLKKALAQRSENSFARTMLALSFLEQERNDRAVEELELAMDFNPSDARPHFYRGLIAQRDGDFSTAEAEYQEALTLAPDFADAHFNLATLLTHIEPIDGRRINKHYMDSLELGAPRDLFIESVIENNS